MKKNNSGFTLVEIIVAIALLAMIIVPVSGIFTNSFKVQGRTSMKTSMTRVAQYIMENFKNKNYLNLKVDGKELDKYIQDKKIEGLNLNGETELTITGEDGWNLEYNNLEYKVDIKLTGIKELNTTEVNIPSKLSCNVQILIDEHGDFYPSYNTTIIATCKKGDTFFNPIDGVTYTATCPTIILGEDFPDGTDASLWIENDYYYYDMVNGIERQEEIRIVKKFDEELKVYVEGKNVTILKGQAGDGATHSQTRITKLYVGEKGEYEKIKNSSEVLLDAIMEISRQNDETVTDKFEFSFPVNYDYRK